LWKDANSNFNEVAHLIKKDDIPFHAIHISSKEDAQKAPSPITTYALFHDGKYLTNEELKRDCKGMFIDQVEKTAYE
jgi:hypothetical protein